MNCLRRAASAFSFSKDSLRIRRRVKTFNLLSGMQRQTRPGVQQAQDFAHHIESIAGVAPPVPGIEGIAGGGANNGPALIRREPAPEQAYSPRVRLGGDKYHRALVFARQRRSNDSDFVGGVHDWRFEYVN